LSFTETDRRNNRSTCQCWESYTYHRGHVTSLILQARQLIDESNKEKSLCPLGAGNLNDVDLGQLLAVFDKVTLVDIDHEAIDDSLRRQSQLSPKVVEAISQQRIVVHAPWDIAALIRVCNLDSVHWDIKTMSFES
jgi:hypothetical protein